MAFIILTHFWSSLKTTLGLIPQSIQVRFMDNVRFQITTAIFDALTSKSIVFKFIVPYLSELIQ